MTATALAPLAKILPISHPIEQSGAIAVVLAEPQAALRRSRQGVALGGAPSPDWGKERVMHRTRTSLVLSSIAVAMLAVASPQAGAQDQPQTQPPQTQPPPTQPPPTQPPMAPPADFSQQQLEAFAGAAMELQRLQTELQAQARNAKDQQEITRLQQQAQTQASQAVENNGLSVEEYTAIAQAATADPQLYAMIVDLMKQRSPQ